MIAIVPIANDQIAGLWPRIGGYLLAGAAVDEDAQMDEALADIANGRARVWMIVDCDRVTAAFLTSCTTDSDGRCLDVYGLGGSGMLRWGKKLTQAMIDYARQAQCNRVVFKGRKALLRAYPGVRIVGTDAPGRYIFERAV